MCFFSIPNKSSTKAKLKGLDSFECGHCPECLQKKSRLWALRTSMEARVNYGCMITLTYDTYKVVNGKETSEENPINPNLELNKKHCQDFIKRLRSRFPNNKIKYLLTAERGKKGRAHYHALLFGVDFKDRIFYKYSDRGNVIYKSKTLTEIWGKGICTIDSVNLNAKTARYCTKYCSKDSGSEETFMLFSRGIGDSELLRLFNGKSYFVDGREYSIPKLIWQKVIEKRYKIIGYNKYKGILHAENAGKLVCNALIRYENKCVKKTLIQEKLYRAQEGFIKHIEKERSFRKESTKLKFENVKSYWKRLVTKYTADLQAFSSYELQLDKRLYHINTVFENSVFGFYISKDKREYYQRKRDLDPQYQRYLEYWKKKSEVYKLTQPNVYERVLYLPDNKYRSYKNKALTALYKRHKKIDFIIPRTNSQAFCKFKDIKPRFEKAFAPLSRHYWANDSLTSEHKEKLRYFRGLSIRCIRNSYVLEDLKQKNIEKFGKFF